MARRRVLTSEERRLWDHVTRKVVPLHSMTVGAESDEGKVPSAKVTAKPSPQVLAKSTGPSKRQQEQEDPIARFSGKLQRLASTGIGTAITSPPARSNGLGYVNDSRGGQTQNAGIDAKQAKRFRRGDLPIDARLDLHGMTEAQAHQRLIHFLEQSRHQGARCLLIITGKGDRSGKTGVLRKRLQSWLNGATVKPHILLTSAAQPRHGGEGAQYVLLRKTRRS